MSLNLRLSVIIFIAFLIIAILLILRKGRLSTKYAILWLGAGLIMILLIVFPEILAFFTKLLGFEVQSNMVFSIFIVILLFMLLSLTIIVSGQKEKINSLIQEVSILKSEVKKK